MKKNKIFYLFPLTALILSGCSLIEGFESAKDWTNSSVFEPVKNFVTNLFGIKNNGSGEESHKQEEQEKHTHVWGDYQVDGDYHYRICTICGEKSELEHHTGGFSNCVHKAICDLCGAEYGSLDEHQFGEWKVEEGNHEQHYHECSVCGEKEYADHSFTKEVEADEYLVGEKNNNCEEGNYYYKSCECGEHSLKEEDKFYVANSHDFTLETILDGDANLASPATCTEPATYYYVCSHCGEYDGEHPDHVFVHGEAKGHQYGVMQEELVSFATYHCNYYQCSECGHYFVQVEEDGVTKFVEQTYEQVFNSEKIQYNDPNAGSETNPYLMTCKEDFIFLRDLINGSVSFEGKYFRVTNDVDFNNDAEHPFGAPIGYEDSKPFNGIFDGENHILSNIYISPVKGSDNGMHGDALSLFSRLTNGVIKNLKLQNIHVEGTGQRCAGLVSRFAGGTIENVEILSGKIVGGPATAGQSDTGGIVGIIIGDATNKSIIKDCVNRAEVTTLSVTYSAIGGIVGGTYGGCFGFFEIDNCRNYGFINATNNGGMNAYAGGIIGLVRVFAEGKTGTVTNCKNFGDVVSNKITIGGIGGMLRAGSIENCYQYNNAKVYRLADDVETHAGSFYASNQISIILGSKSGSGSADHNCYCDVEGHVAHVFGSGEPLTDEATCYHVGHNSYGVCTLCGEVVGEIIPTTEHIMEYEITETTHEHHCVNSGCDYSEGVESHNMVPAPELHVDATPTSDGLDVYVCSVCGYQEEHAIKYKCAHCTNLDFVSGIAPTCHSEGRMAYYRCNECGTLYSDSEANIEITLAETVLPIVEHNFVKHNAQVGFARSSVEYYTCSFEDHDASEGVYFVKENDQYVAKEYTDIITDGGSYGEEGYGTEENPYVIYDSVDLWAFKDAVNNVDENDTFEGKFVKLGADIDVTGSEGMGQIGNHDSRPFSGTFDGDNHVITGFTYSGNDAVGLFSRVTRGTIKNLNLADISISTVVQRSAGVVARADGATINNVHVLSGTISGTKDNGGIVGAVVSIDSGEVSSPLRTTIIENCSNAASVNGTGTPNGGIVGFVHSGNLTIRNCINTGDVTGGDTGTGGVLGTTATSVNFTIIVDNCKNYGDVVGKGYVGGIAGLPRKNSASSVISNCINSGNVSGTSYVGGIVGAARVNVENCVTLANVVLTLGSNSVTASTLTAIGGGASTPGYLVATSETNGAGKKSTVTGICAFEYTITITGQVPNIFADDANIYVWAWGGSTVDDWYKATPCGDNQIKVFVPFDSTGMTVARFDPNIAPAWDSEWNKTGDIIIVPGTYSYSAEM